MQSKEITAMKLEDLDISRRYRATVKENKRITPESAGVDVRYITVTIPQEALHFEVGESIGVLVPASVAGEKEQLRLYSIADARWTGGGQAVEIALCVRRCFASDPGGHERRRGIVSNYLCDATPGNTVTLTGPYGTPFPMPSENTASLLMIGAGTGIAPFRAFIRHIYDERGGWEGKVRLFYGADSGMEYRYINDQHDDLAGYYQEETFQAFQAVMPEAGAAMERTLEENGTEAWAMMQDPSTYVYVAGLRKSLERLNRVMARVAGSETAWQRRREELVFHGRWWETTYN